MRMTEGIPKQRCFLRREFVLGMVLLATGAWTLGCGGGGAGSVSPPPPPPPSITVTVAPSSGTVLLGETLNFSASVSNTTDTAVSWSVNSAAGGSAQAGTISADGVYRAPADLPVGGMVQVTATSHADASKSATANVVVTSDLSVSVAPNAASVELGATQTFQATIASQGRPDNAVRWSLSGATCPNACGAIDSSGRYTAPAILPGSVAVNAVATSVADPAKQASTNIIITSHFTVQLSAPTNVQAGTAATLVASRVRHQHDVHGFWSRGRRGNRQASSGAGDYSSDAADSVHRRAGRANAFRPKRQSGPHRRIGCAANPLKEGSHAMSFVQRRRFLWILFLIGLGLVAIVANATTLSRLRFYQLVEHSSAIARVRCVHADIRVENGEIWTDTAFEVLQRDKGYLPSRIVVRTPGGKFQHLHSHVDGVPEFHPGEEVFLFLTGHPGRQFLIVGWTQGTFRIRKDLRTGMETVTQDSADIPVFDPQTNGFTKMGVKDLRMDLFLEKMNREISRQAL
jgi:hypothetical protein